MDRLERLGISRYLEQEIKDCMDYIYRYRLCIYFSFDIYSVKLVTQFVVLMQIYRHWTKHGICWARDSSLQDVDDTSMGFRLLRLHGYDVSPGKCVFMKVHFWPLI